MRTKHCGRQNLGASAWGQGGSAGVHELGQLELDWMCVAGIVIVVGVVGGNGVGRSLEVLSKGHDDGGKEQTPKSGFKAP
jgi:hypothetical protein